MWILSRLVAKLRTPNACWRERPPGDLLPGTLTVNNHAIQGDVYVEDLEEFNRMIALMDRQSAAQAAMPFILRF